jgi:hypothetical protein
MIGVASYVQVLFISSFSFDISKLSETLIAVHVPLLLAVPLPHGSTIKADGNVLHVTLTRRAVASSYVVVLSIYLCFVLFPSSTSGFFRSFVCK